MSQTQMAAASESGSLSRTPVDFSAMRGVLIFLVILDHNDLIRGVRAVDNWFLPMTFHVAGFLLLPFLADRKTLSWKSTMDFAVRYLVPFFFALALYSVAYFVLILHGEPIWGEIYVFLLAFFIASPIALQSATGFVVLWFLPALLTLVISIGVYKNLRSPWRQIFLAMSIAVHLFVGAFPFAVKALAPQGILIALYMFPLGVLTQKTLPYVLKEHRLRWIAALSLAAVTLTWLFELGKEIEIATLVLPTIKQPLWVLATDVSDISFFFLLAICSPFLKYIPGIRTLGRYSLVVYLIHPLLYKPIFAGLQLVLRHAPGADIYWALAAASVLIVSAASLAVAMTIQASPTARRLFTPRDLQDWRGKEAVLF